MALTNPFAYSSQKPIDLSPRISNLPKIKPTTPTPSSFISGDPFALKTPPVTSSAVKPAPDDAFNLKEAPNTTAPLSYPSVVKNITTPTVTPKAPITTDYTKPFQLPVVTQTLKTTPVSDIMTGMSQPRQDLIERATKFSTTLDLPKVNQLSNNTFIKNNILPENTIIGKNSFEKYNLPESFISKKNKEGIKFKSESKVKDIIDSLKLGSLNIKELSKNYFLDTLPKFVKMVFDVNSTQDIINNPLLKESEKKDIIKSVENESSQIVNVTQPIYDKQKIKFEEFKRNNPQLVMSEYPGYGFEDSIYDTLKNNPKLILDPKFIANAAAKSAGYTVAVMVPAVLGTLTTGNIASGTLLSTIALIPSLSQDLTEEAKINGATDEQAAIIGATIGPVIAKLENVGELAILSRLSSAFKTSFLQNVTKDVVAVTTKQLAKRGVKDFGKTEILEILEENLQQIAGNAAIKTINENREIFSGLDYTTIETAIASIPMAMFGASSSFVGSYLGKKSKQYQEASPEEKTRILNELVPALSVQNLSEQQPETLPKITPTVTPQNAPVTSQNAPGEAITPNVSKVTLPEKKIIDIDKISDLNKQLSINNTNKFRNETINGLNENQRVEGKLFDNLKKSLVFDKNIKEYNVVPIYRATKNNSIIPGDFVTTNKELAVKKYINQRNGSSLKTLNVPINNLVKTLGLKSEFLYYPKNKVTLPVVKSEKINVPNTPKEIKKTYYNPTEDVTIYRVKEDNTIETKIVKGRDVDNYIRQETWSTTKPKSVSAKKIIGKVPSPIIKRKETTLLKDRIKNFARGVKKGGTWSRERINNTYTKLNSIINDSNLEAKDKLKFNTEKNRILRSANPETAFINISKPLFEKITEYEEGTAKKYYINKIGKLIKSTVSKNNSSGILTGKYGYYQPTIDFIYNNSKLTSKDIGNRINELSIKEKITNEESAELIMLEMIPTIDMDSNQLESIYNTLKEQLLIGRQEQSLKDFNKETDKQISKDTAINLLSKDTARRHVQENNFGTFKKFFLGARDFMNMNESLEALLDMLDTADKNTGEFGGFFVRLHDKMLEAQDSREGGVNKVIGVVSNKVRDLYGTKGLEKLFRDNKTKKIFVVDEWFTQNELAKRYQELQDPSLKETFDKMGYTEEKIKAIKENLDPNLKEFSDWLQSEFYPKYHKRANTTYKRLYGTNMPQRKFYSNLKRVGYDNDEISLLSQDIQTRASASSGATKARKGSTLELKKQDIMTNLENYIGQMEHFISMSDIASEIQMLIKDPEIAKLIKRNQGTNFYEILTDTVNDTINNYASGKTFSALDKFRGNTALGQTSISLLIFIKQFSGLPAMWQHTGIKDIIKYTTEFLSNPKKAVAELKESNLYKERGETISRDLKLALTKNLEEKISHKITLRDVLSFFTRTGDQGAIALGGYAYYKKVLAETGSKEKALSAFNKEYNRSQQSGLIQYQSFLERSGGSVIKLFTTYLSSEKSYSSIMRSNLRNFKAGRISPKQFVKTIFIQNILIPTIFQFISNAFKWDWDEQLWAIIMAPFRGYIAVRNIVQSIYSAYKKYPWWKEDLTGIPAVGIFFDAIDAAFKIKKDIMKDATGDIILDIANIIDAPATSFTGADVSKAVKLVTQMMKASKNHLYLLGFSDYALEGKSSSSTKIPSSIKTNEKYKKYEDKYKSYNDKYKSYSEKYKNYGQ